MSCELNSTGFAAVAIGNREYTAVCFHCQQQNATAINPNGLPLLASEPVRQRPVYFKELGAFLTTERERRQWQQAETADMAQRRGLKALTRQVLLRLENGQTKSPDPKALRAIATLYDLEYAQLVARMMTERYGVGVDLSRHSRGVQTDSHPLEGESDGPAETRVRELEARISELGQDLVVYKSIVRRVRPLLIDALAAVGAEDAEIVSGKASSGGDH